METEISGRVRNTELVKIINWIPKVWHHLNRFLEAHSSSDVTIGRWEARRAGPSFCQVIAREPWLPRGLSSGSWLRQRSAETSYSPQR